MKTSIRAWIGLLAVGAAILAAAACSSSSSSTPPRLTSNLLVADNMQGELPGVIDFYNKNDQGAIPPRSSLTNIGLFEIHSVARDSTGNVFVGANNDGTCTGSVFVFPAGSAGQATPTRTIAGTVNTTLDDSIQAIAVDTTGNVYVTQDDATLDGCPPANAQLNARVSVFGPAANGDVAPTTTIFAPNPFPGNDDLIGIALDGAGNVWVAEDHDNGTGNVYQLPNVAGTPAPTLTLTGIAEPWGVAVDAANNVYVVDQDTSNAFPATTPAILYYNAGTTTPNGALTITGPLTKLCAPHDVKVDGTNIYVSNGEINGTGGSLENCYDQNFIGVLVWNVGDSGNIAPRRVLAGTGTTMNTPEELSF